MAAETTFNYFVGGLALLSTLFSMLLYINTYLPGPQMKVFDELLMETKTIFEKAIAETLLPPEMARKAQAQLQRYETQGDDLRAITYRVLTPAEIFVSCLRGHSGKIKDLSNNLLQLRGKLLTTSQKERTRRRLERLQQETESVVTEAYHSQQPEGRDSPSTPRSTIHIAENSAPASVSSTTKCATAVVQWVSQLLVWGKPVSPSRARPLGGDEPRPSVADIEACSPSSTLVGDSVSKDSSTHRSLTFLARWFHFAGERAEHEDLGDRFEPPRCLAATGE